MSETDIIILGASARAAATSARRAGWTPWCADLFADTDLQRMATVRQVAETNYPRGLLDALADTPQVPVLYTGGLENHPGLIAKTNRPLWGNSPEVLRAIRDPRKWTQCLREQGLPCPRVAFATPTDGSWLLKPRKSAGGIGIRAYAGQSFNRRTHFLQQHIAGDPCSAVFVGATLVGVCRQLIGVPWLNASGYQYCGNIGPVPLDDATPWKRLGEVLAQSFGLCGLIGIDAITKDGILYPVEINPRYTASVELFERSHRSALLPLHQASCAGSSMPKSIWPAGAIWGKAILYARQTFAFPDEGPWLASLENGIDLDHAEYADIPHVGAIIERGRPVLTLFASAATVSECETILQEKAQALDRRLWG